MYIRGDLVVHKPTTAIVYNGLAMCSANYKNKNIMTAKEHSEDLAKRREEAKALHIGSVSESSWAYYEKELDKIEQLNQTQSSLHKQMFILRHFANKLGLYDVADYLKR